MSGCFTVYTVTLLKLTGASYVDSSVRDATTYSCDMILRCGMNNSTARAHTTIAHTTMRSKSRSLGRGLVGHLSLFIFGPSKSHIGRIAFGSTSMGNDDPAARCERGRLADGSLAHSSVSNGILCLITGLSG